MHNNMNVNVSGPVQPSSQYKTVVLKGQVPFATQVTEPNTKYVIKHNFTLGEDITIPANCVLEFDGGSISGAKTLTGTNTGIKAKLCKIFETNVSIAGTWNVEEQYPEWFGAKGDNTTNDYNALYACFYSLLSTKIKLSKIYRINQGLLYQLDIDGDNTYNRNIEIVGSNNKESGLYLYERSILAPVLKVFGNGATISNIRIIGAGVASDYSDYISRLNTHGVELVNCKYPSIVENCVISDVSQNGISTIGCLNKTHLTNNVVYKSTGEGILSSVQSYDTVISGNIVGSEDYEMYFGIDSNTKRSIISNNIIVNCQVGITYENMNNNASDTTEANNTRHGIISGNIVVNSKIVGINVSSPTFVKNVVVSNNLLYFTSTTGFDNDCNGITLDHAYNIEVKNNVIRSGVCNNSYITRCNGIYMRGDCKDIVIEANSVYGFQRYGVSLFDQNAVPDNQYLDNITVRGNTILGSGAASIQLRDHMKSVYLIDNIMDMSIAIVYLPTVKYVSEGNKNIGGGKVDEHVLDSSKDNKYSYHATKSFGTTAERPTNGTYFGFVYFDTSLNKPIFKGNSDWVDATGTPV